MNRARELWYRLFGNPAPAAWYCGTCRMFDMLSNIHVCPGPRICEGCGEELISEHPSPGAFPTIWGHIPCPRRNKENK